MPESEEFASQISNMLEAQLRRRGITDAVVLGAMESVPRHEFVSEEFRARAYDDVPLPIGDGQTISQPYIVAAMTAALRLRPGDRVLEIGTGSGYQAAILSRIAKEVFSVERRPELALSALARLERLGYAKVHVHCGDGTLGLPEFPSFDAILVAAAAPVIPQPLLAQLAEGGRMIVPVGDAEHQELQLIEKRGKSFRNTALEGCRFVLLVDDGSKDGTAAVAEYFRIKIPTLRVVSNGVNRGKGFSVRHGMQEARGRIALFTDADLSAPIEEAGKLIDALGTNDLAIGSRAVDRSLISVHESPFREFAGIIFNKIVRIVLWLPFVDTQCGFKAFRRERCAILFEQQRIERFGFDPELLYLARHHGLRAVEIPVRWGHSPATKVNMLRDSMQMFLDVFTIRWNSLLGRYPRKA